MIFVHLYIFLVECTLFYVGFCLDVYIRNVHKYAIIQGSTLT